MKTNEIFEKIIERYNKLGFPPKSNDPYLGYNLVKESKRKIGSWRKVLWLAGVLEDERKLELTPMKRKIYIKQKSIKNQCLLLDKKNTRERIIF